MISTFKEIFKKRKLLFELAKADVKKQFAGSYFGMAWTFIQPLMTILIYILIFGVGFRSTIPIEGISYTQYLISGIVPWFFFSDGLNSGTRCLQDYSYLVKKVVFGVEGLPVVKLASSGIVHIMFLIIMTITFMLQGKMPNIYWIQIIYYSGATFIFTLGLLYFTSAINVFFKDMAQIVGIILQFGMWMVPIMWLPENFAGSSFYPILLIIMKFNPFNYIVSGYRDSLLFDNWFWERPLNTVYFWAVTLVIFYIGNKMFKKMRPHFADVL
jgi:ABC-type polysaccharide/polyol phosphate export systems, permease component